MSSVIAEQEPSWKCGQSFSDEARRAIGFVRAETRRLGERFVGTEHPLLGLLEEKESGGVEALERLGIPPERVRSELRAQMTPAEAHEGTELHFTPRAQRSVRRI
jgi:ATP-dependent Clp protease ATP-binding subunit ClpC